MAGLELTIAEKIALTRRRLGETQEAFADRFNVQPLAVNKWESGESTPRGERGAALNQLFQTVLHEGSESQMESAAYQLLLPFDEPVKIDLRISPHSSDRVRFAVEIRRRAG
jgi:transcriptional regulator with XRE-family HTH domain